MSIYRPIHVDDSIIKTFKPTRLYIKECMGLKYFGKSVQNDLNRYTGSGKRWLRHIKKHGKDKVKTLWISDWYYCPHAIQDYALNFSKAHNIVESEEWANLSVENGLSGGYRPNNFLKEYNKVPRTAEHKINIGLGNKGKVHSQDTRNKRANSLRIAVKGMLLWNNGLISIRARECPGEEWVRGRVKRS